MGDVVWGGTIPVLIDGTEGSVSVESRWLPAADWTAAAFGALLAVVGCGIAWWLELRGSIDGWSPVPAVAVPAALAAQVVSAAEWASMPSEARISLLVAILPAFAAVALLVAARLGPTAWGWGAGALGSAWLGMWAFGRRGALDAAILPTDMIWSVDRAVTAAAMVAALSVGAWIVRHLLAGTPVAPAVASAS